MTIIYELTVGLRAEIRKSESEAQAVAGCQPPSCFWTIQTLHVIKWLGF